MAVFSKSVYPSMVAIMPSVYKSRHFKKKKKEKKNSITKKLQKNKKKKKFSRLRLDGVYKSRDCLIQLFPGPV